MRAPPRRHRRDRVHAEVGRLHVPLAPAAQPLRHVLDERDERDQPRRQEQDCGDQEDAGRVVRLVPRRSHDEELREGHARGKNRELDPAARVPVDLAEERCRHRNRAARDGEEVEKGLGRELAARLDRRAAAGDRVFERDCAHHAAPHVLFMPLVSFDAANRSLEWPSRKVFPLSRTGIPLSGYPRSSSPERVTRGESDEGPAGSGRPFIECYGRVPGPDPPPPRAPARASRGHRNRPEYLRRYRRPPRRHRSRTRRSRKRPSRRHRSRRPHPTRRRSRRRPSRRPRPTRRPTCETSVQLTALKTFCRRSSASVDRNLFSPRSGWTSSCSCTPPGQR